MSRAKAFSSEAFVHSSESSAESFGEGERTRQENMNQTIIAQFIRLRLALTLPVMALAPVFLLARGAPRFYDALTFALLLMPLTGVTILRRSGRLESAQTICIGAMILLGVTLTCVHGALGVGAAACFLLALLEAASGAAAGVAKRVVFGGAGFALAAVASLCWRPPSASCNRQPIRSRRSTARSCRRRWSMARCWRCGARAWENCATARPAKTKPPSTN